MYIEHWASHKNNREDHYFVDETRTEYIFGYNPKYINTKTLTRILNIIYGANKELNKASRTEESSKSKS